MTSQAKHTDYSWLIIRSHSYRHGSNNHQGIKRNLGKLNSSSFIQTSTLDFSNTQIRKLANTVN